MTCSNETPQWLQSEAQLAMFEALVFNQVPASKPWTPVTDYSFEGRKRAEGRHPQLILDTFRPTLMLDAGCGPGHLVRMLNEIAGHTVAYGADPHAEADFGIDLTARIHRPSPLLNFDLVICREVLEHLTLRQQRMAVENLCRLSRRFVYITTRFSSEHDLLRVETHDDIDPTHITIPSKDLLRLLFVLEGFRRRADLETAMDWQQKHRCLVYERAV